MKMTEEDFFNRLRETPRDWYLTRTGMIRALRPSGRPACCPVTRVAHPEDPNTVDCYVADAIGMGLRAVTATRLAHSADNSGDYFDPPTRARLLAACDLTEVSA